MRVVLQPDGRFLWVGNNGADEASSGVTVIDTESRKPVGFVATGAGHHEIVFSADSRHAFVSNRDGGSVTVIDVASRQVVKTLATGSQPLALAHSALARAVYVADGKDGKVTVIDGDKLEITARIALKPGLGPLRIDPDGRFALALNPQEDLVHVIDVATHEHVQDIKISGQPFQITFSKTFAYVRAMHSERVSMIDAGLARQGQAAQRAELRRRRAAAQRQRRRGDRRLGGVGRRRRHGVRRQPGRRHHLLLHGGHERALEQLPRLRLEPARGDGGRPQPEGGGAGRLRRARAHSGGRAPTTWRSCSRRPRCCIASAPRRPRTR